MAKKPTKKEPWVKFEKDAKTGTIVMSRYDCGANEFRLQFPSPMHASEARLLLEANDENDTDAGISLDYNDVQWLAQAMPELLNEMERAGVTS